MMILVIALFALLLLPDLPLLIRQGKKRELAAYTIISAIALVYALRYATGKSVFSMIQELTLFTQNTLGLNYLRWK